MIKVNEISVRRGEVEVLRNFSAVIAETGATLLSGPNGSGKTTLIHAIAGSLPLQAGSVEISNRNIATLSAKELAKLRSVAPQQRIFSLAFTVSEILEFIPIRDRHDSWQATIETLGLNHMLEKRVTELSLGQQQRVSLALSLIQESHFYLLDEPLSAQDSEYRLRILSTIKAIATKKGVLVVSHNTDSLHSQFDQELRIN